jgi:hypothetical protein
MPNPTHLDSAALLNRDCHCHTTDVRQTHGRIEQQLRAHGIREPLLDTHPHLFSKTPVFVERHHIDQTHALIAAIGSVVRLPGYREAVLAKAPPIARVDNGSEGALSGYDFHLGPEGPRLIEVNTNAGGVLLNTQLLRAQLACCPETLRTGHVADRVEAAVLAMFQREWTLVRGNSASPARMAIVDETPTAQYLYPEFLLFKKLLESQGWETVVADPSELRFDGERLQHGGRLIDIVYNRLTDFYLEKPEHAHLREAHRLGAAVLTPHPRAHALYANKLNLALLSDERELHALGVPPQAIQVLARHIPRTRAVASRAHDEWWVNRKEWFFKPSSGYASRGAYRGDKLTRRVFAEIMHSDYVAQSLVPAGLRRHARDSEALRWDLRVYAYAGKPLLHAARLYAGQTTNFRTPGGGFAPVFVADP